MGIKTVADTVAWLRGFGYLERARPSVAERAAAISDMQRVYGLKTDGVAGPITKRAMGLFRCACTDQHLRRRDRQAIQVDEKHCKWEKRELTYAIGKSFRLGSSEDLSRQILRDGFTVYEKLIDLKFTETSDWRTADICIGRGKGARWDFDGPGNVLAWAELPCHATDAQLLSMFDEQEPWNLRTTGPGVIMQAVWLHELGHLLGLDHSDSPDDLLAPYYNPQIILPQPGDVARLQKLYGQPQERPDTVAGVPAGEYSGRIAVRATGEISIKLDI